MRIGDTRPGAPPSPPTGPDIVFEEIITGAGAGISIPTLTSISKAISDQRSQTLSGSRAAAEQLLRSTISAIKRISQKTAVVTTRPVLDSKVRDEQTIEEIERIIPTDEGSGFGIAPGRTRTNTEDTGNLVQRQSIKTILATFNRVTATIALKTPNRKRDQADLDRARAKLQRRCNHNFILATGQCQYCQKKRTDHV